MGRCLRMMGVHEGPSPPSHWDIQYMVRNTEYTLRNVFSVYLFSLGAVCIIWPSEGIFFHY